MLDPTSLAGKRFPLRQSVAHVVVGGGEAGMAAALGPSTLLIDEHPIEPGLIGLDIPYLFGNRLGAAAQNPARMEERIVAARPRLEAVAEGGAEIILGASVWGAFRRGDHILLGLADRDTAWLVQADRVTLATGARDVVVPFEGWTLPGVMGARGFDSAQRLFNDFTGQRVAVLGALPIDHPGIVLRLSEPTPLRILGTTEVEGVAWLDEGRWRDMACDTVILAIDTAPLIELADLLGATIAWDPARGGFHASRLPENLAIVGDAAGTAPVARAAWMAQALAAPDALLCACEEVLAGDLRALRPPRYLAAPGPEAGLAALTLPPQDQVKRLTRAGMGVCQGRRCRDSVHALLDYPGRVPSHRAPLRPLPLAVLAALEEDPALRANWTGWFGIAEQWHPHWEAPPENAAFIGGRLSESGK